MKKKSLKKLGIILALVAISNMVIAGEVFALQQVSININSGSLSFKAPTSIAFKKTMLRAGEATTVTAILDPANADQNLQVIDQAVGDTFHIDVTMQNFQKTAAKYLLAGVTPLETVLTLNDLSNIQNNSYIIVGDEYMKVVSVNAGANGIQVEREQLGTTSNTYGADTLVNLGGDYIANLTQPVEGANDTVFHVADLRGYEAGKKLIAATSHNGGYEHLKVISVQAAAGTITVERGIQGTLDFAGNYSLDDGFIVTPDIIGYDQFKILTLTENPSESVDIGTSNNPVATNNVTAPLDYKAPGQTQTDIIANPEAIADAHFTTFPISSLDTNHNDAGSESEPITLMQRTVAVPNSIGTYVIGMVLRTTLPPETKYGNYVSQLTFTKNP